ncbi:MAG: cob(I)yrinic acid a,c-diamide adenosyltransferase [Deltaproteobacteria bacterium]|nr:MAG: cob(I)yrinic acid a,c-diamide adenosyltransferase [Deltaproteobacteria bacterium]
MDVCRMLEKGLIQVYTSETDQMNFAPLGLSLRAAGHGFRTLITNFTSDELLEGLSFASQFLQHSLVVEHLGTKQTLSPGDDANNTPLETEVFKRTLEAIFSGDFHLVVLNGIHRALEQGLLSTQDILKLMRQKPGDLELVLSGKGLSEQIIERADLVTEMVVTKGPKRAEETRQRDNGTVDVITGPGKGKTTYCLGKAMLMSSMGIPSVIFQTIKSPKLYGEVRAIKRLPFLEIKSMGKGFLHKHSAGLEKKHIDAAKAAWALLLKKIFSLEYKLVVLDEINVATHYGLINFHRVREMLFMKPDNLQLLLSGRHAHPEVTEAATNVIEMREIKHPFRKGIKARKGIEF